MKFPIYLDHHSTTPVDPEVFKAMQPYFTDFFGNPASRNHEFGWMAESAVEQAREQIAQLIGATPREIYFTSGATESDNLALFGIAEAYRHQGNQIITTPIEHKAVLSACEVLQKNGFEITLLPVDSHGLINPEDLEKTISSKTILVSIMTANNEIGTLQPLEVLGAICKKKGVIFHTDAVQAPGKISLNVQRLGVDLCSLSAHKIYGPKGVGALYVRRKDPRVQITPRIVGGGHERGLRSGTLNVPGIVGFGKAAELCLKLLPHEAQKIQKLRDRLWNGIQKGLDHITLNGHPTLRLANNLNISFDGVSGEALMLGMKEVAISTGSACTSSTLEPSYVLKAVGTSSARITNSVRFGLGRFNTEAEIDFVIEKTIRTVQQLRTLSAPSF